LWDVNWFQKTYFFGIMNKTAKTQLCLE